MKLKITTKISSLPLLPALLLALALCLCTGAWAQTWDGTSASSSLSGAGTESNPYLIQSAQDLKFLQKNTGYWASDKYFEQTADIDLGDASGNQQRLWMIGNGSNPFKGKYDGRGYTIKNLKVEWNNTSDIALGLFGYVTGEVRNLVVDYALITFTKELIATGTDYKVGILAGCISPNAKLENIIITNSKITDDGYTGDIKASFVGGLVGDITNGYGSADLINGEVTIKNIYSNVEIDLANYTPNGGNAYQLNVGGVIGRIRRGFDKHLPTNTIFTGKIKAPKGMVGPIFGAARADGENNAKGMIKHYTGQVQSEGATSSNQNTANELITDERFKTTKNNNFFNYVLWDPTSTEVDKYKTVTDSWPEATTTVGTGSTIRTIVAPSTTSTATNVADITMHSFQGVNKGNMLADADALSTMIEEINTFLASSTFFWKQEDGKVVMKPFTPQHTVAIAQSGVKFVATVTTEGGTEATSEFSYKWKDISGKTLGYTNDNEFAYLYDEGDIIKVELCEKGTETRHIDTVTKTPITGFLTAVKNYNLTITATETLPHTVTITATDKDSAPLPTSTTYSSTHKAGTTLLGTYTTASFQLPLQSKENSIEATVCLNGSQKATSTLTLDYAKTLNVTLAQTIPYEVTTSIVSNNGQTLDVKVNYIWTVYNGGDIYKTGTLENCNSTTIFDVPAKVSSDTRNLSVKAYYNDVLLQTSNNIKIPQVTPSIDGPVDCKNYNVVFKNGSDVYTYNSGFTFTWRLTNSGNTTISGDVEFDGTTAIVNDITTDARKLKVKVKDEYGKETSEQTKDLPATTLTLTQSGSIYTATDAGDLNLSWALVDEKGKDLLKDLTAEKKAESFSVADNTATVHDIAFLDRYVQLTGIDGCGRTITLKEKIPAVPLSVVEEGGTYKAKIGDDVTTASSTYQGKTFGWQIFYDDATKATATGNWYTPTNTTMNATYTLVVNDPYGEWKASVRIANDIGTKKVTVSREGNTLTANVEGVTETDGTWEWRGLSGDITDDLSKGYVLESSGNTLSINATNNSYNTYYAIWKGNDGTALVGFWTKTTVVYVYDKTSTQEFADGRYAVFANLYPDGNDNNHGRTPNNAVKTMARAYEILAKDTSAVNNIVVVMGYLGDNLYLHYHGKTGNDYNNLLKDLSNGKYNRNATVTGSYGEISDGMIMMRGNGGLGTTYEYQGVHALGGATIFKDITFYGGTGEYAQLFLYCHLHDLTIAGGVKIEGYANYKTNDSGIYDSKAPMITFIGGFHNYDNPPLEYPSGNAVDGQLTINIASGCWGRIIASARNDGNYNTTSNNIFGHPDKPHRVAVNINIKHTSGMGMEEFAPDQAQVTKDDDKYKYDIGLVTGGQTDGSVYVESMTKMTEGKVGRFISGNISYGRKTGDSTPTDGFYGSTTLTLEGGEIGELVGGTLGRHGGDADKCYAYFYGRTILNINGGTINKHIYGAGAGGVTGIGDNDTEGYHTKDPYIPYYTGEKDAYDRNVVAYAAYATAKGKMPKMTLLEEDERLELVDGKRNVLDFAKSYCEVNINGGIINGNVYGGGYGYSAQVNVLKALDQAGDLFGRSYVNIKGGIINGNVYGGGAGAKEYYDKYPTAVYDSYLTTIYNEAYKEASGSVDEKKAAGNAAKADPVNIAAATSLKEQAEGNGPNTREQFSSLANIYGETSVNITGGIIEGKVFAGSQGIASMPEMATVNGNTNMIISNAELEDNMERIPLINGNIFGGSQLGRVTGNTSVTIAGGAIGNCIFGGSEGIESGTDKTTAWIDGSTSLKITGGAYFTPSDTLKISDEKRIYAANRNFNIYGGGERNCIISGSTKVEITKSLLSSHKNLLEGRNFTECVQDETYRKFSVYGAGHGILTDVVGNTDVNINITGGSSVPSVKPVDVAGGQQFFMICGGGFGGNVYGNTSVLLNGNVFARQAYGGGMYGRIEGKADLTVKGGSYYNVYGGGLLGDIMQDANLTIGTQAESADDDAAANSNRNIYIYDNVYGGNDVGGIVGYVKSSKKWTDNDGQNYKVRYYNKGTRVWNDNGAETWDFTLHESTDAYGVNLKIFGGNILGDVFGAGNGNHTGYYVPNDAQSERFTDPALITRMKYHEGPVYLYRFDTTTGAVPADKSLLTEEDKIDWGLYEYRPRVNKVRMHIGGNSASDRVNIGGSVFGGGHACTIGKFDPDKDVLTDPSKFQGGGTLKMNFGSHVTVKESVYMGSRGRIIGEQTVLPNDASAIDNPNITLNSDYDYHYYDATEGKYLLGFPNTKEGRDRFHAYMKLIDMEAPTELTFRNIDETESTDVRWGSFFAGGARGSMTYEPKPDPETGKKPIAYQYTLPAGLTVETRVVGGSEDAQVVYCDYKNNYTEIDTKTPIFKYQGGIVYDKTSYGGGVVTWHNENGTVKETVGDESPRGSRTVMKLTVNCQFDPQESIAYNADWDDYKDKVDKEGEVESDGTQYWGGLVYGGCYNSGITNGSVEVECTNTLLGNEHFESDDFKDYLSWSSLRRNVGRIYGGGFGESAEIWGNTKVTLSGNCRAFNVFGGGMMGNVTGGTEINIRDYSLVYNAVYGGGMKGHVGKATYSEETDKDLYAKGTYINAISGGIDRIYGGAFMGDVRGGTHISVSDSVAVLEAETNSASPIRLMVGSVYGGNDVSGDIFPDNNAKMSDGTTDNPAYGLNSYVYVTEKASAQKTVENHYYNVSNGYAGYPMVGTIFGAGNGNMADYIQGVTIDTERNCYSGGKIHIANGHGANYDVYAMKDSLLPDVEKAKIDISGGTILNVYAGGNMSTTTKSNNVTIHYNDTTARAAFLTSQNDQMTWGILRLFESLQQEEVTSKKDNLTNFSYQIYRVFGGNNLMDMAIQPTLKLQKGNIFSVYSGGNFGKMTYCKTDYDDGYDAEKPDQSKVHHKGLSLTIDSDDIRIASVYGGGRVGDVNAGFTFGDDEYGATLNIEGGVIGDVYGGNNVAGTVYNGTNVNIKGAISGNVYGSGNGNYIYLYDQADNLGDPAYPGMITEGYNEDYGGRYFILPYNSELGVARGAATDEDKLLAINSYRPNVTKAFLNIQGTSSSPVYVLGNVFCGGNSSTVLYDSEAADAGKIKFEIGSYVTLGGVFLGSNGEGLAKPFNIINLANLNGIDDWSASTTTKTGDISLYPNLLSLYMKAAEVTALPYNFALPADAEEAYIGNFCVGGNHGSMMTDKTINLTLPENLVIFGRVVGGCYNSRLDFKGATALGGMTKPLAQKTDSNGEPMVDASNNPVYLTDKLNLTIKSKFRPWRMLYNESTSTVSLVDDRTDKAGNYVATPTPGETYYYEEGRCNIFGGCYTSGKTVGNINIDLYSDVLGYYELGGWKEGSDVKDAQGRRLQVDRDMLMNNVSAKSTVYALTGAGYGPKSEVEGNVRLRLLPRAVTPPASIPEIKPTETEESIESAQSKESIQSKESVKSAQSKESIQSRESASSLGYHPSISTIFGGSHNGEHIGNSTTEVRDGMVFSNLYAGSRAAYKYGSSEVIVGYPKYYICKQNGTFTLNRADQYSYVAQARSKASGTLTVGDKTFNAKNHDNTEVVKQTVKYRVGDIVAKNVVDLIKTDDPATPFVLTNYFDLIDNVDSDDPLKKTITPATFYTTWDKISINIGDNSQMDDPTAPFYGGGGIYGGGHALNESATVYSGINTQLAYTAANNPDNRTTSTSIGFGGNSTIIIGDNTDPLETKSRISIGTGHYVEEKIPANGDKIGKYALLDGKFVHQASGSPTAGVHYYRMETEGGIYGDGRRTFVEKFRAVDITGYGYADYTPQSAKLINTFQRIDLLSLNDCCLQLQGAKDYATNSIDATPYSIARIGELRLNSSITGDIVASTPDNNVAGNMKLDESRTRNYMGFFNNVHYLGAIYSNISFDSKYRGEDGKEVSTTTYKEKKESFIDDYVGVSPKTTEMEKVFKQRNVATAPNMIGINNGYTLRITNVFTTKTGSGDDEMAKDNVYYGPVVGVFEVKLLTLAQDEGGGYIYAFNQHKDNASTPPDKTFLEETGNFVYPKTVSTGAVGEEPDNYIVDDCYPLGYEDDNNNATNEEAHYWYVTGHHYYFNTTLTAYTYNQDISFKLNNTDNIILLSGITPANSSTIEVESIKWEEHLENNDSCALTNNLNKDGADTREKYKLYLTIDKDTGNDYDLTTVGNAFVARIPNGNGIGAYGTGTDGYIQCRNNYSDESATNKNTPLLGIRLFDTDHDNYKPEFFHAHLEDPDNLVIKITAEDSEGKDNFYTINLSIVYLQGPYIDGKVLVENCALPGEYIYANTGEVRMELDDALTVTGKKWYLYPRIKEGQNYSWDKSDAGKVDVSSCLMDNIVGDVNRIQLPARYYQNDWKLSYSIMVNGVEFPLPEPADDSNRLTVHNYHRMSTVDKAVKKGATYGYPLDLDLVPGALVYIEDDKDFEIFTKYINYCNKVGTPLSGYNANGENVKNPQYGENIRFVLTDDVQFSSQCEPITEFSGILNGKGHIIKFNGYTGGSNFITTNNGELHDIGFVSDGSDHVASVVGNNLGSIENSFYFRYDNLGDIEDFSADTYPKLINTMDGSGKADNCYQNTNTANANDISGVRYRTNELFQNGMVAYNLNQHYLKMRQRSKDIDSQVRETMEIPSFDSHGVFSAGDYLYRYYADGDYRFAHTNSTEHPEGVRLRDNFGVPNYENYLSDERTMHITDLDQAHDDSRWFSDLERSDIVKRDERGSIIYTTDTGGNVVPERTNEGYFPIYLYDAQNNLAAHSDFIFFGQTLNATSKRDYYPQHISSTNRVYRAGGHYGSRADYGFHFNRDAHAMQSKLTAIDFTGNSDLKDAEDGKPIFEKGWNYYLYNNTTGITETAYTPQEKGLHEENIMHNATQDGIMQFAYYPPMLDLPGGSDNTQDLHEINALHIDSNSSIAEHSHITKNLLVYTPEVDGTDGKMTSADNTRLFAQLQYTRMRNNNPATETPQAKIIGHQLLWDNEHKHFHANRGLFHLVDKQDFNAPIEFFVSDNDATSGVGAHAWIRRLPKGYSSRGKSVADGFVVSKDAWEGICLPFTANRVYAKNSEDYITKYNRGPITHFYGDSLIHHDYWLRGLTAAKTDDCGITDNIEELVTFARPGYEDGLFHVTAGPGGTDMQMFGDYFYQSTWFKESYVNYLAAHDVYAKGITFKQYLYLTKNAPYIVAFPGEHYYEYDLSGEFFNDRNETTGCNPQEILYEFTIDSIDNNNNFDVPTKGVRIPVTDIYDAVRHTVVTDNNSRTVTHHGTFARIAGSQITDEMYVLNNEEITNINLHGTTVSFPAGSVFINCKDFEIEEILPFRTYLTIDAPPSSAPKRFVMIGDANAKEELDDTEDPETPKEDDKPQFTGINIFVRDNCLVITSDSDLRLPLYGITGQLYRHLEVRQGYNVYRNLHSGVYIVRGKKFAIKSN